MTCPECQGARLNPRARAVHGRRQDAGRAGRDAHRPGRRFFDALAETSDRGQPTANPRIVIPLDPVSRTIAEELLKEIRGRLRFLIDVGLHYLALDRAAPTLSGGEAQRIRLASQVGAGLVGVLYILDEPSIGLHPRDNDRLLATLQRLARGGQHGGRRRARRRHDARGRPSGRFRARAGRQGGRGRRPGDDRRPGQLAARA